MPGHATGDCDPGLERQPSALDPAEVFRLHAEEVGRWARRLGGPGVDAEEVVQDVFVKVWERLSGFCKEGS